MKEITLRELQYAELEILVAFSDICKENKLRFFLDSGTALGAIRHHGFIPWDDDIDVCMPRKDYDALLRLSKDKFGDKYFLQTLDTDPEYNKLHAKLRKNGTSFLEEDNIGRNMNQGLFIDIYPIDGLPKIGKRLFIYFNEVYQRMYAYYVENDGQSSIKQAVCKLILGRKPFSRFNRLCSVFNYEHATEVMLFTYIFEEHYVFSKDIFSDSVDIIFEGKHFPIMHGYERYLSTMYNDYMKFPPENLRRIHKTYLVDLGE